jgi:hypothetical protein
VSGACVRAQSIRFADGNQGKTLDWLEAAPVNRENIQQPTSDIQHPVLVQTAIVGDVGGWTGME